ncbi:MAG: hypothetical protein QGI88_13680 [SAR202 cluster bacterium]|nr:hypothetical protein [SAR202 cluster bacterium]
MVFTLENRRASVFNIGDGDVGATDVSPSELEAFEDYDLIYRTLCAILFNFVPTSGHPGGSISAGRMTHGIMYNLMRYDLSAPATPGEDILCYAAGHKGLGLYANSALRNEVARVAAPELLPPDNASQMRLEDLLGYRRNPTQDTPLFKQFGVRALDGHPTPAVPFIPLATGASGVGTGSAFGLALGALDYYGAEHAPTVHVVEGEGGMTPGRVSESLAMASASGLKNVVMHVDFNQASIDSDQVCREGDIPGDYVQWTPAELLYLHDWNVISVEDGHDFGQVFAAQRQLASIDNNQPTAIVYRTTKGWRYGVVGKASHGAGHGFCSDGFYTAMAEFENRFGVDFPRHEGGSDPASVEQTYWEYLSVIRRLLESESHIARTLGAKLGEARESLQNLSRQPRGGAGDIAAIYDRSRVDPETPPESLASEPGTATTLRGTLGSVLDELNKESNGALFVGAADLADSTSVGGGTKSFPSGYFHSVNNPESRLVSMGGISEDAIGAVLSGLSGYGTHVGVGSSYASFIAALQHVAVRLHGIGNTARKMRTGEPFRPYVMVCAHAGFKTGEDGPTHAEPQALQLLQGNFPPGIGITLTPWDPQEIWPLLTTALQARPAFVAVFVTRPSERIVDRAALGLTSPVQSVNGVYALRDADASRPSDGTLVLQESGSTYAFVEEALPVLDERGRNLNVYYVSSSELFDRLSAPEQDAIFPTEHRQEAMAISGFTQPTTYRWITSEFGREHSLHGYGMGHFPGSGQAHAVLREARLDGPSQVEAIEKYVADLARSRS